MRQPIGKLLLFLLLLFFKIAEAQDNKDQMTKFKQIIIDGEYTLHLETLIEQGKTKAHLIHNFPGISHIQLSFSYKSELGETHEYKINAIGTKNKFIPISSELQSKMKSIQIENICITYHLFGDQYCLLYTRDLPYLRLSKNGIYFDYANHSKLFNDKLYFMNTDSNLAFENDLDTIAPIASKQLKEYQG